jgi:uncharacterized protein YndB with AHSA1/START domain
MNEYGVVTQPRTVQFERTLPGPIERVWSFLTESDERRKWFAAGEMELRVGGRVELRFHHSELSARIEPTPENHKRYEGGHTAIGRITRYEPPRLLSFTWGEANDSEVTFELTPRGRGVILVLTHRRLRDRAQMVSVSGGWHSHLDVLVNVLNNREDGPFWSTVARVDQEYEKLFPTE